MRRRVEREMMEARRAYAVQGESSHALERRRLRHPHPEASQGGVREVAVARSAKVCNSRFAHLEPATQSEPSLMMPGITISFLFSEQSSLIFRATPL